MSAPRGCDSCGQNTTGVRRVRCSRCDDSVHPTCRDITGTCYRCRWQQARQGGIEGAMVAPSSAGPTPFETNQPATVAQGAVPMPTLFSERHPFGASANELRILTTAVYCGWHIEKVNKLGYLYTLRKRGRGYLRVMFQTGGRVISASTQSRNLTPNTARVLSYLEEK